jgi:dipeptide transport system substrate-binding protein
LILVAACLLASPVTAKTLIYCAEASPEGFDPALAGGVRDASATTLYDRLVAFKPGTTETTPGLAASWDISGDGRTYTFHLRPNVKFGATAWFTPTRDLTADDVIFSFDRQANEANPYHTYGDQPYAYYESVGMKDLVSRWEKIDERTVRLILNRPSASMLANLGMDFASILSKEYADRLLAVDKKAELGTKPVGTGPFRLVSYEADSAIRYKANEAYWDGKPKIDDLLFAITPDASVRWQKLRASECDVIAYPNPSDIPALRAEPGINVMQSEGLNTGYLAFNTLQKPFDDVRVRKALAMAIDRQAIIDTVFLGSAMPAKGPMPPTSWAFDANSPALPYDPEAARRLLDEAGVHDLRVKVWAMLVQRPYNPNGKRLAEVVQDDFAKIGVTTEIVSYEWGEFLKRARDKDRDGILEFGFTSDNGDPDNFLSVPLSCKGVPATNKANWCSPEFDALLQEAASLSDQQARTALYRKAQSIFRDELPWIPIAHSVVIVAMRNKVTGYVMDPFDHHDFARVDTAE